MDVGGELSHLYNILAAEDTDARAFLIRAQNVGVVFRKKQGATIFEAFEASPKAEDVMASQGMLICSFPGPAIEIPSTVFNDEGFLSELANFLVHMNGDILDAVPTIRKANSTVVETRDTTHPRYITELLTGILRSIGRSADVVRISKRVGDDAVWNHSMLPWRRWLVIRVFLQTSLERSTLGRHTYKEFILFLMCRLANENTSTELSNDFLQAMLAKISRRLRKLGSIAPEWLSHMVLETCASFRSTLDKRWKQVQDAQRISPPWAPSQLDLVKNIQLSLLGSREYIRDALANQSISSPADFTPDQYPRHTLNEFLLSWDRAVFREAYISNPYLALFDVEHAVGEGIDAWVDGVTDNHEACEELVVLAKEYSSSAIKTYYDNPELLSIMFLTTIELWVALDKIVLRESPMLADYSPGSFGAPIALQERKSLSCSPHI